MFDKLTALGLKVNNFKEAYSFYKDILGLKVVIDKPEDEFVEFDLGGLYIMFLTEKTVKDMSGRITFQDPSDSTIILSVEVKNLDEVYTKLSQNGAVFIQEPKLTPWDQKVAYFKDTEGYTWEVAETPKS